MENTANKRKSFRWAADLNTLVYIKRTNAITGEESDAIGLVTNESHTGFGVVMLTANNPVESEKCLVKVGKLHEMQAEVVWVKELDEHCQKMGFRYLE